MSYSTAPVIGALKTARQEKSLSQRDLSAKAGVPQGHISKIENGAVDLKLSSLIALARLLDLEVMLVPRKLVPAVQALTRTSEPLDARHRETARLAAKQLKRIDKTATRLAAATPAAGGELARLQRAARELAHLPIGPQELESLRVAAEAVRKLEDGKTQMQELKDATANLERARNRLVHRAMEEPPRPQRPAYTLNDGEDDA